MSDESTTCKEDPHAPSKTDKANAIEGLKFAEWSSVSRSSAGLTPFEPSEDDSTGSVYQPPDNEDSESDVPLAKRSRIDEKKGVKAAPTRGRGRPPKEAAHL